MNEHIDYLRDKANRLSLSPGVYLMKDRTGKIIYVGKAKALKNRVTSYFRHDANHNAKTLKLIDNIADFDFIGRNSFELIGKRVPNHITGKNTEQSSNESGGD